MTIHAIIKQGKIIPTEPLPFEDGTEVTLDISTKPRTQTNGTGGASAFFLKHAGGVDNLPADLSVNHDHYSVWCAEIVILFADSSYYQAIRNTRDQNHAEALRISALIHPHTVLTTEWVFSEFLNSFSRDPLARRLAAELVADAYKEESIEVVPASHDHFLQGLTLYTDRSDKAWSLIDCISFHLMRDRKITHALSFDDHFWQADFRPLS